MSSRAEHIALPPPEANGSSTRLSPPPTPGCSVRADSLPATIAGPPLPADRGRHLLVATFSLILLLAGVALASTALAALTIPGAFDRLFAAPPKIANSRAGRPIVHGEHMAPGDLVKGKVRITNRGRQKGVLWVYPARIVDTPGHLGGHFGDRLVLGIRRVFSNGTTRLKFKGVLSDFKGARLGVLRPGQSRAYRFAVRFRPAAPPARTAAVDYPYMGSSYKLDFRWRIKPMR